jgi:hypothetical protein
LVQSYKKPMKHKWNRLEECNRCNKLLVDEKPYVM